MRHGCVLALAITFLLCGVSRAQAVTNEELEATIKAMQQRIEQQDQRIKELETSRTQDQAANKEALGDAMKEMKADVDKRSNMPSWLDNLKFGGDLRLRMESAAFNWGSRANSENDTRNRARYRLRFGFTKTWLDEQMEVGFRLASGNNNDPTSTNQTLGESSSSEPPYAKRPVWVDLAYAKYSPKGPCGGLTVIGGKMLNPWHTNDIFFDTDVNPEGAWAGYNLPTMGAFTPFAGAGYFVLDERSGTSTPTEDTIMYGEQLGTSVAFCKDVKYTIYSYFQDYDHYDTSTALARGNDSPLSRVPGFGVLGLGNGLDFKAVNQPVNVFFDWARNCDATDETRKYDDQRNAFATGATFGKNKKKGDWSLKYRYAWIEANSLPGEFVDSDFGFSNRQGNVFGGAYNLMDSLTLGLNLYVTQPIFSPTTTSGSSLYEDKTVTVQADMIWKF